jgi:uncharacterized membrane-anchored protein YjiN (DUF445 family)
MRDLKRMRFFATGLLALMTVIFITISVLKWPWPWLAYLRAFAEAGMIGACADWFAVVALFRHPFGLPIPHTAIVPRNKARIGGAIGRFVSQNFLSPKVLAAKIKQIDSAGWVARWLLSPTNPQRVARRVIAALPPILRALPRDELNGLLAGAVRQGIATVPAAPLASKIVAALWAQGELQVLMDRGITRAAKELTEHRDWIKAKVAQKSSRFIPKWVDGIVADKIVNGLNRFLDELRNPAHPWRADVATATEKLIHDLALNPELYERGEELKANMLRNPYLLEQIGKLWTEVEAKIEAGSEATIEPVADAMAQALIALGRRLESDSALREQVNRWLGVIALRAIAPRRAEIGAYITQVVEQWDTDTLVNRIELQVGRDLQYIRINGTLVGGLVGLLIFTAGRWL